MCVKMGAGVGEKREALGPNIQKAGGKLGKDRMFEWAFCLQGKETFLSFAQALCKVPYLYELQTS